MNFLKTIYIILILVVINSLIFILYSGCSKNENSSYKISATYNSQQSIDNQNIQTQNSTATSIHIDILKPEDPHYASKQAQDSKKELNTDSEKTNIYIDILKPEDFEDEHTTTEESEQKPTINPEEITLEAEILSLASIINNAYQPYFAFKFSYHEKPDIQLPTPQDMKQIEQEVEKSKQRLLHIYYTAKTKNIATKAAIALITSLKHIEDPQYYEIAKDALEYIYDFCANPNQMSVDEENELMKCLVMIQDLNSLNNIVPNLVLQKYNELKNNISKYFKHKLNIQVLNYLLDSNIAITQFNLQTKIYHFDSFAMPINLGNEQINELKTVFAKLLNNPFIIKLVQTNWDIEYFTKHKLIPSESSIQLEEPLSENLEIILNNTIIPFLNQEDLEQIKMLNMTYLSQIFLAYQLNIAYDLYLNRTKTKSPKIFLKLLQANLKLPLNARPISTLSGLLTLWNFLEYEIKLPYRKEWVQTLVEYAQKLSEENNTDIQQDTTQTDDNNKESQSVIEQNYLSNLPIQEITVAAQQQLSMYEQWIDSFLKNNQFNAFLSNTDPKYDLAKKEQWAFENIPLFYSLLYQELNIEKINFEISPLLLKYFDQNPIFVQQKLADEMNKKIENALFTFLKVACYGYWIPQTQKEEELYYKITSANDLKQWLNNKNNFQKQYTFIYNSKTFNLPQICGYNPKNIESSIINFLNYNVTKEFKHQVALEVGITAGQIPLTLFSAGIAGRVAQPVAQGARQILTRQAKYIAVNYLKNIMYRAIIRQSVAFMAKKAIPHFISSLVGAIAFTISQRAVLGTITALTPIKLQPFYETKTYIDQNGQIQKLGFLPNIWANYGKEILMGTGIFFVLPIIQTYTRNLSAQWAELDNIYQAQVYNIYKQLNLAQEFKLTLAQVAGDSVVFGSLPMIDRAITASFVPNSDPIWQGTSNFAKEMAEGILISLAFKAAENHAMAKIRKKMPPAKFFDPKLIDSKGRLIDAYKVLGVSFNSSVEAIKRKYLELSKKHHPDKGGDPQVYKDITLAFEILTKTDPEFKKQYDMIILRSRGFIGDIQYLIQKIFQKTQNTGTQQTKININKTSSQKATQIYLLEYDPNVSND